MMNVKRAFKTFAARSVLAGAAFFAASGAVAQSAGSINLPDMSSHPLAGSEVEVQVVVKDALGQTGRSQTVRVRLPQMTFRNQLNTELASFRRDLAVDSRNARGVSGKLGAFLDARGGAIKNPATLANLKQVHTTLAAAQDNAALEQVVGDLWAVMMQLEEDSMTAAEKNLRDAEKALEEALKEGLSEEELKKRMDDAQKALEEMLKEKLDDKALSEEDKKALEDMKKMMEEMQKMREEMEKMSPSDAQKMLQQMQQMQQGSPKSGRPQKSMQQMMEEMRQQMQQMQEMKERMEKLQKLIEEQQKVLEETEKQDKERSDGDLADMQKIQDMLEKIAPKLKEELLEVLGEEKEKPDDKRDSNLEWRLQRSTYDMNSIERVLQTLKQNGQPLSEAMANDMIHAVRGAQELLNQKKPDRQQKQDQQEQTEQMQEELDKSGDQDKIDELRDRQSSLKRQLEQMMSEMVQKGQDPGKMRDASGQMDQSTQQLGDGQPGQSMPSQDSAIKSMQQAMQDMQKQMQMQQGSGAAEQGYQGDDSKDKPDPMGRANPGQNMGVKPSDAGNQTRAIRDQIRERLEDPALPARDRQYLERLLNGNQGEKPPQP